MSLKPIDDLLSFLSTLIKRGGVFADYWFTLLRNCAVLALLSAAADNAGVELPWLRYIYDFSLLVFFIWIGAKGHSWLDLVPEPRGIGRWLTFTVILLVMAGSVAFTLTSVTVVANLVVGFGAAQR